MHYPYWLSFASAVAMEPDGDGVLLSAYARSAIRVRAPGAAKRHLLAQLVAGGMDASALCDAAAVKEPGTDPAQLYYLVSLASNKAFLRYTVACGSQPFASLEPVSPALHFEDVATTQRYRVSRFACMRRQGAQTIVESPLGHAHVVLHDARAATLLALMAQPHTAAELADQMPQLDVSDIAAFTALLHNAGVAFAADGNGCIAEDASVPLRQWEFHDLLFHSRSRQGRHGAPMGATFRLADSLPALSAVKPSMSHQRMVFLGEPPDTVSTPFFSVLEMRKSQRMPSQQAIAFGQLGAFLYHAARVKSVVASDATQGQRYEASLRPAASGGAMHAIELYLTVSHCDGLAPGFYHYDPLAHALEFLAELGLGHQGLIASACHACSARQAPDVLISMAARFQRNAWKYQSMAYALILKDVGALFQQFYLVATALNLAPCALGGGDSDLFASLSGEDYYTETTVGEFVLSGV